ncbi:MAG: PKD domain-containing protein, partial [Thermoplasmata archaeon]|nr:PKD domain-containing protein [Thermoplasmata archaeon]
AVTVRCWVTDSGASSSISGLLVTVNAAPSPSLAANRTAADVGQAVGLSCANENGTAPVSLSLAFGDGFETAGNSAAHTYSASGQFLAQCTAVDGTGTVVQSSLVLAISPTVAVTASASSPSSAPGTAITFQATPANGSGTYRNITWSFGDGAFAYTAATSHRFTTPSAYSARVTVVDSNGGAASATATVTVSPIELRVTAPANRTGTGDVLTFVVAASGGAGAPYNLTWRFGDGTLGYGASVAHNYSSAGQFLVTVTASDRLGANNSTALPAIEVAAPTVPGPWFTTLDAIGLVLLLVALVIVALVVRRRAKTRAELERAQGRVPPTDPNQVTKGAKVCRNCGSSNLPGRSTCVNCGRPLRRSPLP